MSTLQARKALLDLLSTRGRLEKMDPSNLDLYFILLRRGLANEVDRLTRYSVQRELRAAAERITG